MRINLLLLLFLFWFVLSCKPTELPKQTYAGVVTFSVGSILKTSAPASPNKVDENKIGENIELKTGDLVFEGDVIVSGAYSSAHIQLHKEAAIKLSENSSITIARLKARNENFDVELKLAQGGLFSKIDKLNKGSQFSVNAAALTAGVRGTSFSVQLPPQQKPQIMVDDGKVQIKTDDGQELILNEGQKAVIDDDKKLKKEEIDERERQDLRQQLNITKLKEESFEKIEKIIEDGQNLREQSSNKQGVELQRQKNKELIEEVKQQTLEIKEKIQEQNKQNTEAVKDQGKTKVEDMKDKNQQLIDKIKQKK